MFPFVLTKSADETHYVSEERKWMSVKIPKIEAWTERAVSIVILLYHLIIVISFRLCNRVLI